MKLLKIIVFLLFPLLGMAQATNFSEGASLPPAGIVVSTGSQLTATPDNHIHWDSAYLMMHAPGEGGSGSGVTRYLAMTDGSYNVEVLADSLGITAALANTNELTFTIPAGVHIVSAKIRYGGTSTLKVFMGTTDMGNTNTGNRWMPIVMAWREDSGGQLGGLTTTMDVLGSPSYQKFTINGLINSTMNHIRISF